MKGRIEAPLRGAEPALAAIVRGAAVAALEAGAVIRSLYDQPHQIRFKGEIDLVTEADLASEKVILAALGRDFPGMPVLAEESSPDCRQIPDGPLWVIDPLDGTTNFAHGFPCFAVSIAYSVNRVSLGGVIYCPMQDELFLAWRGGGAWLNGRRLAVSRRERLLEALVGTGFPYAIRENLEEVLAKLRLVLPRVRDLRRAGAAAVDLAYVACGRLDAFWERELKPWDTAAGYLLVEEAGGRVSDFAGGEWDPYRSEILAGNPILHGKLVDLFVTE
ncbi:MAG TPA: inositol monophosphatase family protein [Desulfurivibrionaceae bacterium]|nr:inositol monophosphatase family protein [Desulfurivibrionaceae bacterium]